MSVYDWTDDLSWACIRRAYELWRLHVNTLHTFTLGMIHIRRPWKLSNFQDPLPPCPSTSNFIPPPRPWTFKFKHTPPPSPLIPPPPLQMITNQLKENIIQGWLSDIIRSFLRVGSHFQHQLINFVWFSDFFSFSGSLIICFLLALYSYVCCCPKISQNVFYLWLWLFFFFYILSTFGINLLAIFAQLENVNKLWNNKHTVHVNEQNQIDHS